MKTSPVGTATEPCYFKKNTAKLNQYDQCCIYARRRHRLSVTLMIKLINPT
ncbi:MAG: hypothetical protein ACYT04_48580 [Nostoc sp.]